MSGSDSEESVDQLEKLRYANVRPGMFVSGWEDPNDEVFDENNPRGKEIVFFVCLLVRFVLFEFHLSYNLK